MTNSHQNSPQLSPVGGDRQTPDISRDGIISAIDNLKQTPSEYATAINTFMRRRTHMNQYATTALSDPAYAPYIINHGQPLGRLGDVSNIHDLRGYFTKTPNGADAPLTLEIGFGMGDSLLDMAVTSPKRNFIGIEVHEPGIGRTAYIAHQMGLTNLKVINGDAIALLGNLPDDHLDVIQLYFPDPWQKKRHYKRRFVTHERMTLVANKLKSGGIFHMATDWEHYALWSLEILDGMSVFSNMAGAGNFSPRPDNRPETKFEKRGHSFGRGSWDLLYQKR